MKQFKLGLYFCLLIHAPLSVAQGCNPNMNADAPDSRYTVNANGTVVDKKTALTWMRCALGQAWNNNSCTGSAQPYNWQNALQAAGITVFSGKSDWRLPNIKELQSLVESRCYDPAINLTAFPNATSDSFWSSSPVANDSNYARLVYFSFGYGSWYFKDNGSYVRLVRSGQ